MTRAQRLRVGQASSRRRNRFWLGVFGLFATTVIAALAAWAVGPMVVGWKPYAVTSNSMGPVLERGDVLVVQSHDGTNLAEDTIILFDTPQGLTAHRIDKAVSSTEYVTKGDANRQPDSTTAKADQIVGVARVAVPLVGRLLLFASEDPIRKGVPLVVMLLAMAWASRFAVMARFDPWALIPTDELASVPVVDESSINVDRIIATRRSEESAAERSRSSRRIPGTLGQSRRDGGHES